MIKNFNVKDESNFHFVLQNDIFQYNILNNNNNNNDINDELISSHDDTFQEPNDILDETLEYIDDEYTDECNETSDLTTEDSINFLIESNTPQATQVKRKWAKNKFCSWASSRNIILNNSSNINELPVPNICVSKFNIEQLLYFIPRFIVEVKDNKGKQYCGKTLMELILNLQQYINQSLNNVDQYKFLSDLRFKRICDTLDATMKISARAGLNNLSQRKANVISQNLEDSFWSKGLMGLENPSQLLDTLIFYIGLNFALRGVKEHENLTLQNFTVENENGCRILVYKENVSKCNQGGIKTIKCKPKEVHAFSDLEHPERDILKLYEKYLSHRPSNCSNRLYLRPLIHPNGNVWYSKQHYGIHKISTTVNKMAHDVEENGFFSTHSLRATAATRLYEKGCDEQLISEITGHRSLAVREYKRTSSLQKQMASNIVQGCKTTQAIATKIANFNTDNASLQSEDKNVYKITNINTTEIQNKKMKVQCDGANNIVTITFQ